MPLDQLAGIIAYPVTPFTADGRDIDEGAFRIVVERLLATGAAAITILGSAGESAYLRPEEWRRAVGIGVATVAGRVPLIAGIGELTTTAAVDKARFAADAGADALMVVPVSYWKLTEAEVFGHFATIGAATSLPIMAYNNPSTSGVDMSPALLVRLVREIEAVRVVKESSGDLHRMHALHELSKGAIRFYNGANHLALEALAAGASGWCTAAPNLLGAAPANLFDHVAAGRMAEARTLFYHLLPLLRFIVLGGLPSTVKAGLRLQGIEAGDPRLPLLPLAGGQLDDLARILERVMAG